MNNHKNSCFVEKNIAQLHLLFFSNSDKILKALNTMQNIQHKKSCKKDIKGIARSKEKLT